jgi:transketolase
MLSVAKAYSNRLKEQGHKPYLISMHTVKPLDTEILHQLINEGVAIYTLEEHSIIGGLGSAVAEVIAESGKAVKFKRIGIPDTFSHYVGNQDYLREKFSLSNFTIDKCY